MTEPEEKKPGQDQQGTKKEQTSSGAQEQTLGKHMSYWPFVLACSIFIFLMGVVTHPVVLVIGVILILVAVIGWGIERQ